MKLALGLGLFVASLLTVKGLPQARASPHSHGASDSHGPAKNHLAASPVQEWRGQKDALELARRNMQFGFNLFQKLAANTPGNNIFFSPLSISTAFSMLSLGAQDSTLREIKEGFNFKEMLDGDMHMGFHYLLHKLNQDKPDVKLHLGNVLFMDAKLHPQQMFLRQAQNVYDAETVLTNFQNLKNTQKQINSYISRKTNGKITDLVRSIDPGTVMLLANYIHFRARWQHEFNPKDTKYEDFFIGRGKSVSVPMMFRGGMYDMAYDKELSCAILEMPYHGNITATFILPDKGKLEELEQGLRVDIFAKWKSLLSKRVVDVWIPRLQISATYDMKRILSGLGISRVFEEHGDLTKISTYRSLKVGEAVHKAELKMDEKGTEGAAGSGAQTLPMETPERFKLNHPFLMMLYEKSMPSMIFLARIYNPSGK